MYVCMHVCMYVRKEGRKEGRKEVMHVSLSVGYKLNHGGSMSALVPQFPSSTKSMQVPRIKVPIISSIEAKTVCKSFRVLHNQLWHEFQAKRQSTNKTTDLAQIGVQFANTVG